MDRGRCGIFGRLGRRVPSRGASQKSFYPRNYPRDSRCAAVCATDWDFAVCTLFTGRLGLYGEDSFSHGQIFETFRTEWEKRRSAGFQHGVRSSCHYGSEKYRKYKGKTAYYIGYAFYDLFCETACVQHHYRADHPR